MASAIRAGAGDRHHLGAKRVFEQMAAKPPAVSAPTVSVIVPGWGAAPFLAEALASLQSQSRTDWEAIVVDDGDTDAVAQVVAPFLADARFRLLQTDNGGLAVARNRGIQAARADRIALLDGDDRYRPDYLDRMLGALDAAPDIGFVTCDAWLFGAPAFQGKLFSELQSQSGPLNLERVIRREFRVFGAATMRRTALAAVGGYDARLRSAEDLDLWIRLLEAGWRGVRVDAALYEYRRHAASLSASGLSLARWVVQVYANAVERLEGRPEQAAAREMLEQSQNKLQIEEGMSAILAGDLKRGVATLASTDLAASSPKWRAVMTAIRLFPALARPVIRFYMRDHPFHRAQSSSRSGQASDGKQQETPRS
jgi:GT2 family glycosyltransferase